MCDDDDDDNNNYADIYCVKQRIRRFRYLCRVVEFLRTLQQQFNIFQL
ncbi:hypothetical protein OAV88_00665 [bacterium]|nr:hypothetical protein [bacterium]